MKRVVVRASLLALGVIVVGCGRKVEEPDPITVEKNVPSAAPSPSPLLPMSTTPPKTDDSTGGVAPGALEKVDMKVGTGTEAKTGSAVKVHYTGRLTNGTKFDSSLDRNEPFEFTLGKGEVIPGWDEGVVGMKVGGKRKLTIGYEKAYGEMGSPPTIPPKATLVFEIELLEVK